MLRISLLYKLNICTPAQVQFEIAILYTESIDVVLRICNLWILLKTIVIYLVDQTFYLR